MSSYLFSSSCLDPLQGVLDFVSDVKPFRTKVIQAGVSITFSDSFAVAIVERWQDTSNAAWISGAQFDIDQTFNLHTGNCTITDADSCLLLDGFESEGYGNPQYDAAPLKGAIALTTEAPVALTFFTRSYVYSAELGAQFRLPTNVTRFKFQIFSDAMHSTLIAQSPEITVTDFGDSLTTDLVTYQYGEYTLTTSTTALSTRPTLDSTGRVTFTIASNQPTTVYYVITDESLPQQTAFGSPTNQGFESTSNYSLFTDYARVHPIEGNPSFAYYTHAGDPVFYVTGQCGIQPIADTTQLCSADFDVMPLDSGLLEATEFNCEIPSLPVLDLDSDLCPSGFEYIPLNGTTMEYADIDCIQTCGDQYAGLCSTDSSPCYDRSPTTVAPTFSETLEIRDTENDAVVIRFIGAALLEPIYAYELSNDPAIESLQFSSITLEPIQQYAIVCYTEEGYCRLANYADTSTEMLGIAINSAVQAGEVISISTLSGSVSNPLWTLPTYESFKYVWIGEKGLITPVNPATLSAIFTTHPQPPIAYIVNASTISFDNPNKVSPVTLANDKILLARNYAN